MSAFLVKRLVEDKKRLTILCLLAIVRCWKFWGWEFICLPCCCCCGNRFWPCSITGRSSLTFCCCCSRWSSSCLWWCWCWCMGWWGGSGSRCGSWGPGGPCIKVFCSREKLQNKIREIQRNLKNIDNVISSIPFFQINLHHLISVTH